MNIEQIKRKAEAGDAAAQEELSSAYEMGKGVPQDILKAYEWTKKSAEQGYAKGQFYLGMMYLQTLDSYGKGKKDFAKAAFWFAKAADQDYKEGGNSAGGLFGLAIEMASASDIKELVNLALKEDGNYKRRLGASIIKDNNSAGLKLIVSAADDGHAEAQSILGTYYQDGRYGLKKDNSKAFSLYQKAAEQNCGNALYNLAACYEEGVGVAKDIDKAIKLFEKANKFGGNAHKALENAKKIKRDAEEAAKRAKCAAAIKEGTHLYQQKDYVGAETQLKLAESLGDDSNVFKMLGMIYLEGGDGINANFEKAVQYLEKGLGEKEAYYDIGISHLEGKGVKVNLKIAVEYLEKTLALGKKESKKPLKTAKKLLKKSKK